MPKVARAPKGSPRVTIKPQSSPTPVESSASSLTDLSPPESVSGDEDSNGEDDLVYHTDSLTSHPPDSSSISADILPAEASNNIPIVLQRVNLALSCPYGRLWSYIQQ